MMMEVDTLLNSCLHVNPKTLVCMFLRHCLRLFAPLFAKYNAALTNHFVKKVPDKQLILGA